MGKEHPDRLNLDEAVERIMAAKGVTKRTARKILLKALRSGELKAYVWVPKNEIH